MDTTLVNPEAELADHIKGALAALNGLPQDQQAHPGLAEAVKRLEAAKNLLTGREDSLNPFENPKFECYRQRRPNPDLGRRENAPEFLERVWGAYLKACGAKEDNLYQDQLWKIDSSLMQGLMSGSSNRSCIPLSA